MSRTSFGATRDHARTLIDRAPGNHQTSAPASTLHHIKTRFASTIGARFDLSDRKSRYLDETIPHGAPCAQAICNTCSGTQESLRNNLTASIVDFSK
jgi:hypothetical protein